MTDPETDMFRLDDSLFTLEEAVEGLKEDSSPENLRRVVQVARMTFGCFHDTVGMVGTAKKESVTRLLQAIETCQASAPDILLRDYGKYLRAFQESGSDGLHESIDHEYDQLQLERHTEAA